MGAFLQIPKAIRGNSCVKMWKLHSFNSKKLSTHLANWWFIDCWVFLWTKKNIMSSLMLCFAADGQESLYVRCWIHFCCGWEANNWTWFCSRASIAARVLLHKNYNNNNNKNMKRTVYRHSNTLRNKLSREHFYSLCSIKLCFCEIQQLVWSICSRIDEFMWE